MGASKLPQSLRQRFAAAKIRDKLTLLVTITLVASALFFYLINASLIINDSLHDAHNDLELLADVAGHNLEAPLVFKDRQSAQEVLLSLRENPQIALALLTDNNGQIIAKYQKNEALTNLEKLVRWLPVKQTTSVSHIVVLDDKILGKLSLVATLKNVWIALITQLLQIAAIILAAFFLGAYLSRKLSILIIEPIQQIAKTAHEITKGGDYSLQVKKTTDDEVGELAEEFNNMLAEINHRDQALQSNRERLDFALQGSNDGLWDWNLESDEIYFSPRWKSMLGYNDAELSNTLETWQQLIDPDALEDVQRQIATYIHGNSPKFEAEFRMRHKDGYWVDILARGKLAVDANGNMSSPRRLVGTHMDISERKRNEQELRIAARRLTRKKVCL